MSTKSTRLEVLEIPLSEIAPDPNQPRKQIGKITDLMASIKSRGVLQPILVEQAGKNRFRIISGHRRFAASKALKFDKIPAIVRATQNDLDRAAIQLHENYSRRDLTPFEEADAMHDLIMKHGMKQKQLAEELGMSPAAVNQRLRLRSVCEALRKEIQTSEREISQSLLLEIAKIEDAEEQMQVWRKLQEEGNPTVRAAGAARRRGSYNKRYEDFTTDQNGLKIMVRWKLSGKYSDRRIALEAARKQIDKELEELI